jgi:hypothetical protein
MKKLLIEIIITDLTRFSNKPDIVCIAGINPESGECIRPMPYIKSERCKELNILPGSVLSGNFTRPPKIDTPHGEDRFHDNLTSRGHCTSEQFKEILSNSESPSVESGFGVELSAGQKCIPLNTIPPKSIITISVCPPNICIVQGQYKADTIKLLFTDKSGKEFRYLPVTDLAFYEYVLKNSKDAADISRLNSFLRSQNEIFLRLGLSRPYLAPDGREGFWIQVNGIYTFPMSYFKRQDAASTILLT